MTEFKPDKGFFVINSQSSKKEDDLLKLSAYKYESGNLGVNISKLKLDFSPNLKRAKTLQLNKPMSSTEKKAITKRSCELYEKKISRVINSNYFVMLMMVITLIVLFIPDISNSFFSASIDQPVDVFQTICFIVFLLEILANVIVFPEYLFSFFFWLDLFSTLSLILDVDYLMTPLFNSFGDNIDMSSKKTTLSISKATSAGRVTKVLRIVRIIRIVRIVKLYKATMKAREMMEKRKKEKLQKKMKAIGNTRQIANQSNASNNNMLSIPKISQGEIDKPDIFVKNFDNTNENDLKCKTKELRKLQHLDNFEDPFTKLDVIKLNKTFDEKVSDIKQPASPPDDQEVVVLKETNISKILSESITRKLILLILGLILGLTVINEDMYLDDVPNYDDLLSNYINIFRVEFIEDLVGNNTQLNSFVASDPQTSSNIFFLANYLPSLETCNCTIVNKEVFDNWDSIKIPPNNGSFYFSVNESTVANNSDSSLSFILITSAIFNTDTPLYIINATINGTLIYINDTASIYDYRSNEVSVSSSADDIIIYHSTLYENRLSGLLNIFKTLYIMGIIVIGALVFESDSKALVLDPLEIMIEIVEIVEEDPIIAKNAEALKTGIKNQMVTMSKVKHHDKGLKREINADRYEIKMIENSIVKISSLLAICFGEAGGDIIRQNLEKGKDFNPMVGGRKKQAIFGFCDIRQFPFVNDALKERTMIFVNQISEIVHSSVDRFAGATNKNIGDAFLSAWRFRIVDIIEGKKYCRELNDRNNKEAQLIADQSVLAFLQVIIKINSDPDILEYKNDQDILNHSHLKNYKVKMGFGLHLGWAIEGAIGSTYKIDASYLSPNVNISARLEGATKQYGVYILISGEVYDICSEQIQGLCRLIDVVAVKGSIKPIRLYTIDVNISNLGVNSVKKDTSAKKRYDKLMKIKELMIVESTKHGGIVSFMLSSKSFKKLLNIQRNSKFLPTFNQGIKYYLNGDWENAGSFLSQCLQFDPEDGPSKTIYSYIQSFNFKAELKGEGRWEGFRALSSK